ncbi:MAG: DUF192 domain-containing protein [candidate division WOR-3 bacterium]|nr:DUF192 domain-containing protein [candidate division WOR-3 bacterium]MCX7836452.1 DUF192 domain-containing protein [candidate division WOR-3 bacterium]MDW8114203.1 DUF192 domain-containing protein [candidate division WOR-3 bacterium]
MRYLTLFVAIIFFLLLIFYLVKGPKTEFTFEKEKKILLIKNETLYVEIADNPEERAIGLSFRKNLPHNEGMLFIFEKEGIYPFWMKNTFIPLDIAFISKDNIIIDIQRMTPLDDKKTYQPNKPFLYALEVNQGYFEEKKIKIGDTILLK